MPDGKDKVKNNQSETTSPIGVAPIKQGTPDFYAFGETQQPIQAEVKPSAIDKLLIYSRIPERKEAVIKGTVSTESQLRPEYKSILEQKMSSLIAEDEKNKRIQLELDKYREPRDVRYTPLNQEQIQAKRNEFAFNLATQQRKEEEANRLALQQEAKKQKENNFNSSLSYALRSKILAETPEQILASGTEAVKKHVDEQEKIQYNDFKNKLEARKDNNLALIVNKIPDEQFMEKFGVYDQLLNIAEKEGKSPADLITEIKSGQRKKDTYFFKGDIDLSDAFDENGNLELPFKMKLYEESLPDKYQLYQRLAKDKQGNIAEEPVKKAAIVSPQQKVLPKFKGVESVNPETAKAVTGSLFNQKIYENEEGRTQFQQMVADARKDIASNPATNWTIGLLDRVATKGTRGAIQGMGSVAAAVGSILPSLEYGDIMEGVNKGLNTFAPNWEQPLEGAAQNFVMGGLEMVSEFGMSTLGAGGILKSLGKIGGALNEGKIFSSALGKGLEATEKAIAEGAKNKLANKLLNFSANTLGAIEKGSLGSQTVKFADNVGHLAVTIGGPIYSGYLDQLKGQGYTGSELHKKASQRTLLNLMAFASLGSLMSTESQGVRKTLETILNGEDKAAIDGATNKAIDFVKRYAPAIGINSLKGLGEMSIAGIADQYQNQQDQFDKAVAAGEIPKGTDFKFDFKQAFDNPEFKHGALMGLVFGATMGTINKHGVAPTDAQSAAIASALTERAADPQAFDRKSQYLVERGILQQSELDKINGFLNTIGDNYYANKTANTLGLNKTSKDPMLVQLSVEQARLAEAQRNLETEKQTTNNPEKIEALQKKVEASQQTIEQLKNGSYIKGRTISGNEMAQMAQRNTKGGIREEQLGNIEKSGPYKQDAINISQYAESDPQVKMYLQMLRDPEIGQQYMEQRAKLQLEFDKLDKPRRLWDIKLSDKDAARVEELGREIEDLDTRYGRVKEASDIVGYEPNNSLTPIIDKDGKIIDGKKRIAYEVFKGNNTIDIARPITEIEAREIINDGAENSAGLNIPDFTNLDEAKAQLVADVRNEYEKTGGGEDGVLSAARLIKEKGLSEEEAADVMKRALPQIAPSAHEYARNKVSAEEVKPAEAEVKVEEPVVASIKLSIPELEKIPFEQRTDEQHADLIKRKFVNEFVMKGVPKEQVDAAVALMDARAKASGVGDAWYRRIENVGNGEFQQGTPRLMQIIGEKGAKSLDKSSAETNLDNLLVAKQMDLNGISAQKIKLATGWEKGADGKWKLEIPDDFLLITSTDGKGIYQELFDKQEGYGRVLKLSDIVSEKLNKIYPEFGEIKLKLTSGETGNFMASYSSSGRFGGGKNIDLSKISLDYDQNKYGDVKSIIHHEIQHAIQEIEGFARGGSKELFSILREISNKETVAKIAKSARGVQRFNIDIANSGLSFFDKSILDKFLSASDSPVKSIAILSKLDKIDFDKDNYVLYKNLSGEVESRNVQRRINMTPNERRKTLLSETEDVAEKDKLYLYDAIENNALLFQDAKGAVETLANGRKIIHALDAPDFSTAVHEVAHIFEGELSDAEKAVIQKWAKTSDWNTQTSETFARGFERYLRDGNAPTDALKVIFQKAKEWLQTIYQKLKGSPIEKRISPEVKEVFDNLFKTKENAPKIESTNEMDVRQQSEDGGTMVEGNAKPEEVTSTGKPEIGEVKTEGEELNQPRAEGKRMTAQEWLDKKIKEEGLTKAKAMKELVNNDYILDGLIKQLNLKTPNKYKKIC